MSHNTCGAYTGEIGSHQLKDIGSPCWVIIGHSERREGFGMAGEPEDLCALKSKVAIDNGLKVMFLERMPIARSNICGEKRFEMRCFFCLRIKLSSVDSSYY
jgi:hypothetical protein